jgi:protein ImuB
MAQANQCLGKQRSVYGKVVNLAGPWRTSGDWWRDDSWSREEWDVALDSGKIDKRFIEFTES